MIRFTLPPGRVATGPPERRGLARDEVRLLVARTGREPAHAVFRDLPGFLAPGDLLVVNTSATRAAAVDGLRADGRPVSVHFSHRAPGSDEWVVEVRSPGGADRVRDVRVGEVLALPAGVFAVACAAQGPGNRLWRLRVPVEGGVDGWLDRVGRPIAYGRPGTPLAEYQTVFARDPGSAEMPSAGRPFSARVLDGLARRGVGRAEVTLHCGVSSTEAGEPPPVEWYRVPEETVRRVAAARAGGGRVVAVGTTVVRALESAAGPDGLAPAEGWTDVVVGPDHAPRVVDGLVSGWHEPDASHLLLLEAVAGHDLVERAYAAALAGDYLWHEFGDSCLFLPLGGREW